MKPTTQQVQLDLLESYGMIQSQIVSGYVLPVQHDVPAPSPTQTVLFYHFVLAGVCFPLSDFLLEFLEFYRIELHHLTPNGVLFLSLFVHLCEVFIGIPPCLTLFRYFFCLKIASSSASSCLGCCVLQTQQERKTEFFSLSLNDSLKWMDK